MKRNYRQRQEIILSVVNELGEVSVDDLATQFSISKVTIRKDLIKLEQEGQLIRKFGGAVSIGNNASSSVSTSKLKIAETASSLIQNKARIILDSGETTASLIPHFAHRHDLVVMTNSLRVAENIRELEHGPSLLMTGGTWDDRSESFQGQVAEQVLGFYDFDQLFIGADGLDLERGTTTFNELLGLSQVMAKVAKEVVVMAESEKIGKKIPNLELSWSIIDILVTDDGLSATDEENIKRKGVRVIRALQ